MTDIKIIRLSDRIFLQIGKEMVEISDYGVKSSGDGSTEISVTIKGTAVSFEMAASIVAEENNSKEENENEK